MTGARHSTDESGELGKSDTPYSYGPNLTTLVTRSKATTASRQDDSRRTISSEPQPGKALDFN